MEKAVRAYEALFMLVINDPVKASAFARLIPKKVLNSKILLAYLRSNDKRTREFAKELITLIPGENLDYKSIEDLIWQTDDEDIFSFILNLIKKIPAGNLNYFDLLSIEQSPNKRLQLFVHVLLVKNFGERLPYQVLIRAQDLSMIDTEISEGAIRYAVLLDPKDFDPELLIYFQKDDITETRDLAKTLAQKMDSNLFSFERLKEILVEEKNPFVRNLIEIILLRNFAKKLDYDDVLKLYRAKDHQEVSTLAALFLLSNYTVHIDFEMLIEMQDSPSDNVRSKSKQVANNFPVELLALGSVLGLLNSKTLSRAAKELVETIANKLPVQYLDLEYLLKQQSVLDEFAREVTCRLATKIPLSEACLPILCEYQRSTNENVRSLAIRLQFSLGEDFTKEAEKFVKKYFS